MLQQATRGVEARCNPNHTYTASAKIDHQIHSWFRGRWPSVPVVNSDHEHYLVDPAWWNAFFDHFGADVPDMRESCILQLDTHRPMTGDNIRFVYRGVWLAIEITRSRERVD